MRSLTQARAHLRLLAADEAMRALDPHAVFWLLSDAEVLALQRDVHHMPMQIGETYCLPSR